MGFTQDTYRVTVNRVIRTGSTGFWYVEREAASNKALGMSYIGTSGGAQRVESVRQLFPFDTFREVLVGMISNNIELADFNSKINVNTVAERESIQDQFEDPAITDQDLLTLSQRYNIEQFCIVFGSLIFVRRYFIGGLFTLNQLSNIYITLGQKNKATLPQVLVEIDILIGLNLVTVGQKNSFITTWNNQVN